MTSSERAAVIAEKVMGWCYCEESKVLGYEAAWLNEDASLATRVKNFNPDHNIAQAFEALEKWRADTGGMYDIRSPCKEDPAVCCLYNEDLRWWQGRGETIPVAIVYALIEAAGDN